MKQPDNDRSAQLARRRAYEKRLYARHRAKGQCTTCKNKAAKGRARCRACLDRRGRNEKRYYAAKPPAAKRAKIERTADAKARRVARRALSRLPGFTTRRPSFAGRRAASCIWPRQRKYKREERERAAAERKRQARLEAKVAEAARFGEVGIVYIWAGRASAKKTKQGG